ncbi:unnamed protein product, partial [Amoebophrya sp. A120]
SAVTGAAAGSAEGTFFGDTYHAATGSQLPNTVISEESRQQVVLSNQQHFFGAVNLWE